MFEDIDQELVSEYVVGKLAGYYGGYKHFWEDPRDREMIMQAWKLGINDLTPRQVFAGLYRIISGDPSFVWSPPKHVIAFKFVCLDSTIADEILDKDLRLEYNPMRSSDEVTSENLKKLRGMLCEAMSPLQLVKKE
jgi:hypothetical protein